MALKYITAEGKALLEEKLAVFSRQKLELTDEIATAAGFGDVHYENAEFDAATEQMSIILAQRRNLNDQLATSRVLDSLPFPDAVRFGVKVTVFHPGNVSLVDYRIVGPYETTLLKDYFGLNHSKRDVFVSYLSPFVRAMIGKVVGDEFTPPSAPHEKNKIESLAAWYEGLRSTL